MKHLKKTISIIAFTTMIAVTYSAPLGVSSIEVLNENTIEATLSENPNMKVGEIDAEVNILGDVKLIGGFLSEDSARKVELLLETPLKSETNYSLLSVSGANGSIDFTTPSSIEGYMLENALSEGGQDIENIEIIDSRTILISYKEDLSASTFEYKLLAENTIVKIEKQDYDSSKLTISLESPLVGEQDYILMFIDMQDVDGNYIEFDTGIYDFTTPVIEAPIVEDEEEEVVLLGEDGPENSMEDEEMNFDAAADETSLEKENLGETETIAMSAESTPETGAQTWILVLITLVINSFYYFTRRKRLQVV